MDEMEALYSLMLIFDGESISTSGVCLLHPVKIKKWERKREKEWKKVLVSIA